MKIFTFIFLTVLVTSRTKAKHLNKIPVKAFAEIEYRTFEDKLEIFIESFKEIFKHGNETLGIPVLDPYKSNKRNLSFESDALRGELSVDSINIHGFSNYEVNEAKFRMIGLKMTINLQWPKIVGDLIGFSFDGKLFDFIDIYGEGDAEFTLRDLEISADLIFNIDTKNRTVFISMMETEISLGSFQFYSEGIFNDKDISQVISAIISDEAPKLLGIHQEKLTGKINAIVMDKANDLLREMSLKEIIDILYPPLMENNVQYYET